MSCPHALARRVVDAWDEEASPTVEGPREHPARARLIGLIADAIAAERERLMVRPGWRRERKFYRGELDRWILEGTGYSVVKWAEKISALYGSTGEQVGCDHDSPGCAMDRAEALRDA